ncbi:MAG: hypothetical protein ACREN3_11445 [Gemmatimonadaceae bacterium]
MSDFTAACEHQARTAWGAAMSWPDRYAKWKNAPSLSGRAQRGCLGMLIFGVVYVFVPLIVFVCVETVLLGYALLASVLWGVGAVVDGATRRRSKPG